ncbi:CoA-binding protein [Radiomyces spectabilis]|uniref:CoA-binding protein n=1 Tax=Radiomyces spectabilis TaxID=64574 RepID=UPI00222106B3|nr:CoA-binding protein [Radiomyces spectabilis]KAI8365184.1 CoA-binding protein [Radiomyces spectabilis]
MSAAQRFIRSPQFAVVGASTSPEKFGNKVLRWYIKSGLKVIPINPKVAEIESLATVASIKELPNPTETALSVITPPKITLQVLKDAEELGIQNVWIQPGAEDGEVMKFAKTSSMNLIMGGPCILVQGPDLVRLRGRL